MVEQDEREYMERQLAEMRHCLSVEDKERAHSEADEILIEVIRWMAEINGGDFNPVTALLYDIADAWGEVPKWYA